MIGVGEGIAIFAVCGTIIAGIIKFKNGNGKHVRKDMCEVIHKNLDDKIDRIDGHTTALLKHFKIKE